jgi:methyltransferase-like protein 6
MLSCLTPSCCARRAQKMLSAQDGADIKEYWRNKYENEASKMWNLFYRRNTTNFFKDRHYLQRLFDEVPVTEEEARGKVCDAAQPARAHLACHAQLFVEVGCGVGNGLIPMMEDYPWVRAWLVRSCAA